MKVIYIGVVKGMQSLIGYEMKGNNSSSTEIKMEMVTWIRKR